MRPEVGVQPQFKKTKPPTNYTYDSSLSPALNFDAGNAAREQGEAALREIMDADSLEKAKAAAAKLKSLGKPFLDWAGKAERLSFDVPTLPLFVHERLSTKAILETIKGQKTDKQMSFDDLFGDPRHSIADQVLKAYEHKDQWVNRMVLGDSLVVMNSLLHYEGLGGQVQTIYMDPPYGVKFGSNFQPFIKKRAVKHGDDEELTREPEMVRAYRDTWEMGLHSYLTYMRDRLLLARELLSPTGSIFVQIGDENLHHVRELLDEVFGAENFSALISFTKTTGLESVRRVPSRLDYIIWYAKDVEQVKYRPLYELKDAIESGFDHIELVSGERRLITPEERRGEEPLPKGARLFMLDNLTKPGPGAKYQITHKGKTYDSGARWWGTPKESLERLLKLNRAAPSGNSLRYVRYFDDFPYRLISNLWDGIGGASNPIYVVQTSTEVVKRCLLLTTDPGDLVLDTTCGSGTTAYVAEEWGRRWITTDVSRVPLALARQRLLTATFPYYHLQSDVRGPAGGFRYEQKLNRKGENIGGIVPHVTLESLANNEKPKEEILVDRPKESPGVVRVSGPFTVEATIPAPLNVDDEKATDSPVQEANRSFVDRMLEVLRRSPVLHLNGKKTITLKNLRLPAKTLSLSAEAIVENGKDKPVALVFGPENGAISERVVQHAAKEANLKGYAALYVVAFAIQPNARQFIEQCEQIAGIAAFYIQATPDLMMGDLLKNMRSSQIFSVCGLPEIKITTKKDGKDTRFQVELLGLDVFDPVTMDVAHRPGDDVPAWFLDTNYNDLSFHVSQAFFPRTGAWDNLRRSLKGDYKDQVWDHLAGSVSAPFDAGDHQQVAVKVIDDRGNELLVVKSLKGVK